MRPSSNARRFALRALALALVTTLLLGVVAGLIATVAQGTVRSAGPATPMSAELSATTPEATGDRAQTPVLSSPRVPADRGDDPAMAAGTASGAPVHGVDAATSEAPGLARFGVSVHCVPDAATRHDSDATATYPSRAPPVVGAA